MKTIMELNETTKECIENLMKVVSEENKQENNHLGSYEVYDTYCDQIEKAITSEMTVAYWAGYQNLRIEEMDFFNPYEAYIAGREAKLDGELDKAIAYKFYLEKIKSSERYREFKKGQEVIFKDLMHALETDFLRDRLSKIDQLYKRLYAPFERNLWIFFNLGYDCCPA